VWARDSDEARRGAFVPSSKDGEMSSHVSNSCMGYQSTIIIGN
jgi:hypothetical protein